MTRARCDLYRESIKMVPGSLVSLTRGKMSTVAAGPGRVMRKGLLALGLVGAATVPTTAQAQWSRAYEQFYLPGDFNFTFRREYAGADRLFNAFDYGHAILYERLYNDPGAPASDLETDEYDFITKKLLVSPPDLPLEESAIEVNYAKLAPEAKMMFDWAHLLHRQIYDVLASEKMSQADKDAKIAELVRYYRTRPDLAFSSVPKNMDLMESQPYSLAFRQRYPKFNGLIWGYHWLQVGLYEPLMTGKNQEERQAGVIAAVARFRQMLDNAPEHMPRIMPMTAAIAPTFAARYQEASIIFDNLHAMHDVVSDILTNNDKVPRNRKRAAILEAASRYRDATSFPMSVAEWSGMGAMMGIENMGGPAVGFLAGWQTPTLARGASMAVAMRDMAGMQHGAAGGMAGMAGMAGMSHAADSSKGATGSMAGMAGMSHNAPGKGAVPMAPMNAPMTSPMMSEMMQMHQRMMSDPVIRERMMADTSMRRMMQQMDAMHAGMANMPGMPGMDMTAKDPHGAMSHADMPPAAMAKPRAASPAKRNSVSVRRAARTPATARATKASKPAPKVAPKAPPKSAPKPAPMDHSKMPGMGAMPGMKP